MLLYICFCSNRATLGEGFAAVLAETTRETVSKQTSGGFKYEPVSRPVNITTFGTIYKNEYNIFWCRDIL